MLEVQKFLQNKTLEDLTLEFGINITSAYGEEKAKLIMQDMDLITNITNMAWSIT